MSDINTLYKRYTNIEADLSYRERKRVDEIARVKEALGAISSEDVNLLKEYIPSLPKVVSFTEEEISLNNNGEVLAIQNVMSEATALLEKWLSEFEEALC